MLVTSNLSFAEWGGLLGDDVLATALLDRLLHHAEIITINGRSYRMRDRMPADMVGQKAAVIAATTSRRCGTPLSDLDQIGLARVGQKPSAIWVKSKSTLTFVDEMKLSVRTQRSAHV